MKAVCSPNFLRLILLIILSLFLSGTLYGSRRTNNDVVTGKLLDPGPWDYFIYDSLDRSFTLDEGETDQKLSDGSKEVTEDGEAKDAGILSEYADVSFDKFVIRYHESRNSFKKNFVSWLNRGKKGERPVFKLEEEKKFLQQALSSYRHLIFDFPKDKHTDELYYRISLILSLSKNDNTQLYLKKIFKTFPNSPLKDRALLLLANHLHYKGKAKSALKYYRKLFRSSDNKVRLYGKYMAAWIFYHKNKKKRAVFAKKLMEVVRIALIQDNSRFGNYMIEEALSDLVKIWDQPGYLGQAEDFFSRVQKNDYYLMTLERVAKRQIKMKKYPAAIKTYQKVISASVVKPNTPQIHRVILDLYKNLGNHRMIIITFKQMEKRYLTDSPWTERNKDHVKEASELMENALKTYSIYMTKKVDPENRKTLAYPIALLEMYLKWFKTSKIALKIRLRLAQLQSKAGMHLKAGQNYKRVSDSVDEKSRLKYSGFVIALNEIKKAVWNQNTPRPGGALPLPEPALIPKKVQIFVDLLEEFVKKYKEKDVDIGMQDVMGDVYYTYGHYKKSEEAWGGIISNHLESRFYPVAAMKQLSYYNLLQNWEVLSKFSFEQMNSGKITEKKDQEIIMGSLHKATFELANQFTLKKNVGAAVETLLKYQGTFPAAKEADLALQKAYELKSSIPDISGQLVLGNTFLRKYVNSPLLNNILLSMGDTYAKILEPDKAATFLSYFVNKFPKDQRVAESVWKIAAYYMAADNPDRAILTYMNFIKRNPAHSDVNRAFSSLFQLLRDANNTRLLVQISGQYLNGPYPKLPVNETLARVYVAVSQNQQLLPLVNSIASLPEVSKKPAAEVLSQFLLVSLNGQVRLELGREPDFSQDIQKMADGKKSHYRQLEEILRQITLMGRADKVLEGRFRLATLYSGFARKLNSRIKRADEKMKVILENIAFESQEVAEKYFELINDIVEKVIAPESKTVFEGMVTYKKKFRVPAEIVMKPLFTTLTTY